MKKRGMSAELLRARTRYLVHATAGERDDWTHADLVAEVSLRLAQPFKKKTVPLAVRRDVARRYGASHEQGGGVAPCHYCAAVGRIYWSVRYWVTFDHEMEHVIPEFLGGATTAENIVLACRPCNRRKGARWTG